LSVFLGRGISWIIIAIGVDDALELERAAWAVVRGNRVGAAPVLIVRVDGRAGGVGRPEAGLLLEQGVAVLADIEVLADHVEVEADPEDA
jgi:hypothetical protein